MHKNFIHFWLIILSTFLNSNFIVVDGEKQVVIVGALFFPDESDIESSFDQAFRVINNIKYFEISFKTIKRYVASDDSYILQQLTCELIANGVAAIFGPSSKASSDIVAVIANATGIPHIQFDWKIESYLQHQQNHLMSVNVAPDPSVLGRAYLDIVKGNFNWKVFTIIYETDEGLARLQDLMTIEALNKDFIKIRNIQDFKEDYRILFKDVFDTFHEYRLIVDCTPATLEHLLRAAMDYKLLGSFRNWFLTHLDTHSSKLTEMYNADYKANITSVRLKTIASNPYAKKKSRISKIDEILGNQTMLPLLIYDAVVLFANSARNIIFSHKYFAEPNGRCTMGNRRAPAWEMGYAIVQEMKTISEDDVEPSFKTENMQFDDFGRRTQFNLEIYKPTLNEPLAVWKPDGSIKPITVTQEQGSSSDTEDFSAGRKFFTVVTRYESPYFMLKEDQENFRGIEKYKGYAVDLIQKLSEILDFDYEFTVASGNGQYDPVTKEWDGIMRKLIDHEAEIGVSDLTITQARRQVVDFTMPFMQLGIAILYYNSPPEPKEIFAFLKPFANEVWYYMILAQLLMTLSFVLIARLSRAEWVKPNPADSEATETENIWNTSNSFWLMIGSIMQQGCDILPRGGPMRILTSMWWFFALMMLSTYTANLAAFLTMEKSQITVDSLSDLIEQDEVKYGTSKGGSTILFFSESNDTEYSRAWNQMKAFTPSAFTTSTKEGVARVLKEKGEYAFLMETTTLSYNVERNCNFKQIGDQIGEKHYGLAVPLGATYRSNLSVSLLQLSEKGELYRLKNKWWKNPNGTCPKLHADGDELSITELGGVFLVLICGIALATIIGILEFFWNVERISVEQKVTPNEALKSELTFFFKFWIKKKPVLVKSRESIDSKSWSRRSSDVLQSFNNNNYILDNDS